MGFIKRGLFIIIGVLLFLSLLLGNLFLILNWSLNYDIIQPELKLVVKSLADEKFDLNSEVGKLLPMMQVYCQNGSEYVFSQEGIVIVIPCEIVSQGLDSIVDYGLDSLVEDVYYEDYDCDFWDCFEKTGSPSFLVSKKAKDYWAGKFYFALVISIFLAILMFLLAEQKGHSMVVIGSLIIGSALPFMKFNWILSLFSEYSELFSSLFIKTSSVFWIMLCLGIVVLMAGVGLHFLNIGTFISEKIGGKSKEIKKKN